MITDTWRTYTAGAAITKRRLIKCGAVDTAVLQAAAATDAVIGVAGELDAASGARIDVALEGIVEVEYGGTVTRGDRIVSDANGKAVAWTAAAGGKCGVAGIATKSGVSGDIGEMLLSVNRGLGPAAAINAQVGTTYTLAAADMGGIVSLTNGSAITLTLPTNATVPIEVGESIEVVQGGAGGVTISGAGTTIVGVTTLAAAGQACRLTKTATDTWLSRR